MSDDEDELILKNWVRIKWLQLRMGFSSYLAYGVSFINLVLLISLRFPSISLLLIVPVVLFGLSFVAIAIGHYHLKWQQETDIRLEYEWIVKETVTRLKEEMKNNGMIPEKKETEKPIEGR